MNAAKEKSLSPASLTALRVLLLLVAALFLPETRVWGFAASPHPASGQIAFASASAVGEIAPGIAYDASGSLVAAETTGARIVGGNGPILDCVNSTIATDANLAGTPTNIVRELNTGGAMEVETATRGSFDFVHADSGAAQQMIEQQMLEAGPGARGTILGSGPEIDHVFNVYNHNGQVLFIDNSSSARFFDGLNNIHFSLSPGGG